MSDRQGVEIDFCPQCRGVWLDRGELDKIIERASASLGQAIPPPVPESIPHLPTSPIHRDRRRDDDDDDYRYQGKQGYDSHGKKKKGFLGDLFDF
jgi:Zn-finger nucleic acid-binding protein